LLISLFCFFQVSRRNITSEKSRLPKKYETVAHFYESISAFFGNPARPDATLPVIHELLHTFL